MGSPRNSLGDKERNSMYYQPTVTFFADTEGGVFGRIGDRPAENPDFAVSSARWDIGDAEAEIDDPGKVTYSLMLGVEPELPTRAK